MTDAEHSFIPVETADQMKMIESLAREIWTEHYTPMIGRPQVEYMLERFQSRHAVAAQIESGVLYFLMHTRRDGEVGYLAVQPRGRELFVSKIYVRAALRKKGHGRRSMIFAESLARKRGLDRLVLTVNKNNKDSISVYERFGFVNAGSVVQDIGNGFVMDDYLMKKEVA